MLVMAKESDTFFTHFGRVIKHLSPYLLLLLRSEALILLELLDTKFTAPHNCRPNTGHEKFIVVNK